MIRGPLLDLPREEISEIKEKVSEVSLDYLQDGLHFLIQSEGDLRRAPPTPSGPGNDFAENGPFKEIIPIDNLLAKLDLIQEQGLPPQESPPAFKGPATKKLETLKEASPVYSEHPLPEESRGEEQRKGVEAPPSSQTSVEDPVSRGVESSSREELLEFIRRENLPLATYLAQADLKVVDENTLEWDFKGNSFQLGLLEGNGNKKKLEKLCHNFFKRKIKIRFFSGEPEKGPSEWGCTPGEVPKGLF